MKTCRKCQLEKPATEFSKSSRNKDGLHSWCKTCFKAYEHDRLINGGDRERKKKNARASVERLQEFVWEYLKTHHCVDCGESDPVVLEFDHREPENKLLAISDIVRRASGLDKLKIEIAKCDVRCANCHRRKTAKQFGSWKTLFESS